MALARASHQAAARESHLCVSYYLSRSRPAIEAYEGTPQAMASSKTMGNPFEFEDITNNAASFRNAHGLLITPVKTNPVGESEARR